LADEIVMECPAIANFTDTGTTFLDFSHGERQPVGPSAKIAKLFPKNGPRQSKNPISVTNRLPSGNSPATRRKFSPL
jgi:hypothetical protein